MHFRVPGATYRLQFNRQFNFQRALEVADYLHELGITDCYASPLFQAGPLSTHGYDTCSFHQFNPNLGGSDGFEAFVARLRHLGLGLLLDMVPNHMGADLSNCWWRDVLERGENSPYAHWFDIDWESPKPGLKGKVLLPILEDHYAIVLEAGKFKVVFEDKHFALAYHDRKLPLMVPQPDAAFAQSLPAINGTPGVPSSFDRLHGLLQQQHYRLAYWRSGPEEINYRRFFDITELVSLRMELPEVFAATHQLVLQLISQGKVTGLRIDHPDGLWDPKHYLEQLQAACGQASQPTEPPLYVVLEKILTGDETLPANWPVSGTTGYDFLNRVNGLFVNGANRDTLDRIYHDFTGEHNDFRSLLYASKRKVLLASFCSELDSLLTMLLRVAAASRYGQDFTPRILRETLVEILVAFPVYRSYINAQTGVLSTNEKEFVTAALLAAQKLMPHTHPAALQFIGGLLQLALPGDLDEPGQTLARNFVMKFQQLSGPLMAKGLEDTAFYNFNRLISLNEVGGDPDRFGNDPWILHAYNLHNAEHWPHTLLATATHDTKRGEDARARINVLAEIPDEWRAAVFRWQRLNADKKSRLGDRLTPEANDEYLLYQTLIGAWEPGMDATADLRPFAERVISYMLKATREAKTHTSWTDPDPNYEQAAKRFVEQLLLKPAADSFLQDFTEFQKRVAFFAWFNSLAQLLIKMTAPGVPDFYQGTELWDFNLVDPDNRRPVDFGMRRQMLHELTKSLFPPLTQSSPNLKPLLQELGTGRIKLYSIWRTLAFRREHRELYEQGAYLPLAPLGSKQAHAFAFARILGKQIAITIVPRLVVGLCDGIERAPVGREVWQDTFIAPPSCADNLSAGGNERFPPFSQGERYHNFLTGETVEIAPAQEGLLLADALASFPIALLEWVC